MDYISITNSINNIKKIINNYEFLFNKFSVKNLGIDTINNLKIFLDKKFISIKEICDVKIINEKKFLINFKNIEYYKKIIKNNFFENYGFQILKKKNFLELTIPKLSLEFRNNILKIVKKEFINHKDLIEINRKKILNDIKKNIKCIEDLKIYEKILNKEIIILKLNLQNIYQKILFKILNE